MPENSEQFLGLTEPKLYTPTVSGDSPLYQPTPAEMIGATPEKGNMKPKRGLFAGLLIFVVLAGVGTGYLVNKLSPASSTTGEKNEIRQVADGKIKNGDVFGATSEKDLKDNAEGYLEIGGIDGEGSHRLLREGGINQTVYLTSSVTDLDKFSEMRVRVWGETFKAQKAGWLMDVVRVQVVDTEAQPPFVTNSATSEGNGE